MTYTFSVTKKVFSMTAISILTFSGLDSSEISLVNDARNLIYVLMRVIEYRITVNFLQAESSKDRLSCLIDAFSSKLIVHGTICWNYNCLTYVKQSTLSWRNKIIAPIEHTGRERALELFKMFA